jgi:uncharacterized protein YndB with AHSA1/START domain
MRKITRTIVVNTSPERVFDFVDQPENLLMVWPGMIEVAGIQKEPSGGHSFDWVYKMAGVRFHGHSEVVRVERPRLMEAKNEKGIPSKFRWAFEAKGEGTQITLDIEYTIPTPVLGKVAEAVVAKINEHETEALLANIKQTLELQDQPATGDRAQPTRNAPANNR